MKILYSNTHHGNGGGHVTYIINLLNALGRDHDVWVATPDVSRLYRYVKNLPHVHRVDQRFTSRLLPLIREVRALRQFLKQEQFDIVHVNASADHRHFMLASLGLATPPKIIWTRHNDRRITSVGHWLRARLGTDRVIAVSNYVAHGLASSPYRLIPFDVIHHGIDVDHLRPVSPEQRMTLRQKWFGPIAEDVVVFGSVGGTDYEKGWLDLVDGVATLPAQLRQRVRIIVAGDPPDAFRLEKLNASGIADQVVFPGLVDDIRDVLGACDVGFVLSHKEALSFACRETMAMGLPVLISNAGGLPENLGSHEEGWIVPVHNRDAVAQVVSEILALPQSRIRQMGEAARNRSESDFSLGLFAHKTLNAYQAALGQPRS